MAIPWRTAFVRNGIACSIGPAPRTGFKAGLFSGKIASATTLAAPDLNVITLRELAEQARRITRASAQRSRTSPHYS